MTTLLHSMAERHTSTEAQDRARELSRVLEAYNEATERLRHSHEHLTAEVERLQGLLASKDAQLQRSRRLAALGQMAAGIAHEIRNPLGAIGLYAGMLVEDLAIPPENTAPDAAHRERMLRSAERIAEAVRGLDGIVNDVLSFARELRPRLRPLTARQLFERGVEAYRPAIDAAGIEVRLDVPDADEPGDGADAPVLLGDADLMHQAMLNLVRNGVEAMQGSHRLPRVLTLGARCAGQRVRLMVRDTGDGIDPDAVERIFNPFFTTRDTGTGLGLAIVHRILDAHDGTISVRNDGGAVFELDLPATGQGTASGHAHGEGEGESRANLSRYGAAA